MNEENQTPHEITPNLPGEPTPPTAPPSVPPPTAAPMETTAQASVPPTEPMIVDAPPEPVGPSEPLVMPHEVVDAEADRRIRQISRRSFLWAGVALIGVYAGDRWLNTRRLDAGTPWPFRKALEFNESLTRDYFQIARPVPTFPRAMARDPKDNGDIGLDAEFDPEQWELSVEGLFGETGAKTFSIEDIKKLPRVEMVTELKCIEGWSQVVQWAGVRLADLMAKYPPSTKTGEKSDVRKHPEELPDYVYMETPDATYFVGLDMASALHPQTLLCYEMNGKPLTLEHGAPLRLAIPLKYGIKNIKRIGLIRFTNDRPKDYWGEEGYDWYSGH